MKEGDHQKDIDVGRYKNNIKMYLEEQDGCELYTSGSG
jgi:hypothetical protein